MIQLSDIPIILLLCGICFFLSGMLYLYLHSKQNQLAQEVSYVFAGALYVGFEVISGIYSEFLTIPVIFLIFLLLSYEAFRPLDDMTKSQLERVNESDRRVLCFKRGRRYYCMSTVKITSLPFGKDSSWKKQVERTEQEQQLWRDVEELRWLMPLWEEGQNASVAYTLDAKLERGLVSLYIFIGTEGKNGDSACDVILRSQTLVSTWLARKEYGYSILTADEAWKEYVDLSLAFELDSSVLGSEQTLGLLLLDGIPKDPSEDIAKLVRGLSDSRMKGHLHISGR